jgi:membrane protease YdiL (CAAX protease family)
VTRVLPWIGGAALAGCAVFFAGPWQLYPLLAVMLFFPLLDRRWPLPAIPRHNTHVAAWAGLALITIALVLLYPQHLSTAAFALLIAALPEEWFFRAYFQSAVETHRDVTALRANLVTSVLFSLIHGLSRDWTTALLVFVPSLFYGWLYQRTRDLPLLVLVHGLSNLVFALFLGELIYKILDAV